jgi:hypothetical protein
VRHCFEKKQRKENAVAFADPKVFRAQRQERHEGAQRDYALCKKLLPNLSPKEMDVLFSGSYIYFAFAPLTYFTPHNPS